MDVPVIPDSARRPSRLKDREPGAARAGPRLARWGRGAESFASANAMLFVVAAAYASLWSATAQGLIRADSWMTFNDGREVVERGIPHHISMTVIGHGATWIDQQWLGQILFWLMYRLGGLQLSLLCVFALLLVALMIAMRFAQRRGASVAMMMPFVLLPMANFSSFLRAQAFSPIFFVVVVAVLAAESRRKSWRAFALLPILVLWANLHGAVLIGVALVSLLGLTELPGAVKRTALPSLARAATLMALPALCLIATPYGPGTLDYYRATMSNHALHQFEGEWQAPPFASLPGFPLFVVAALTLVLIGKRRRDLTTFEIGALAVTLVAALLAARSIPWFLYAALMLMPPLAERAWRHRSAAAPAPVRVGFLIAVGATVLSLAALAYVAVRPTTSLDAAWPQPAAAAVGVILVRDPHAHVFASFEYADWLLLSSPAARGRVAFNGHLELLSQPQLRSTLNYLFESGSHSQEFGRDYRVVVLNPVAEAQLVADLRREPRTRVVYSGSTIIVLDRGSAAT